MKSLEMGLYLSTKFLGQWEGLFTPLGHGKPKHVARDLLNRTAHNIESTLGCKATCTASSRQGEKGEEFKFGRKGVPLCP